MICLDNTDVIEGGAATDAVVEYTMHGLVGTTFTQLAAGVMNTTLTTVLYLAGAAVSVVSIILVNKHTSAVAVTLTLDPADGGNPRYIIPKTVSLGAGYSLHTDGARITIVDTSGNIQSLPGSHASRHLAAGADPITTMITSTNVVTDHRLLRGDGGVRGSQETTVIVDDNGQMTNPSQPAFLAYAGAILTAVTGNGVAVDPVVFNTEVFDQNGDYNNGSGVFTAPVAGRYKLNSYIRLADLAAGTAYRIAFKTSNRDYFLVDSIAINVFTNKTLKIEALVDMDAADTAHVYTVVDGGTQTVDITGDASVLYSWFSGKLDC